MASKTLHTNQITFMDLTDDRKLDVYITSNLPITQIKDSNANTYTPDWSSTNLVLSADVYLDSQDITDNTDVSMIWYEQIGTSAKMQVGTGTSITIEENKMTSNAMVTYSCDATYQGIAAHSQITFTRVDTGLNGSDGTDAPAVQAQYSVDGSAWTSTLNTATHKYIRHSYDGGKTWTTAIKMVGEDGTSVRIKGTATSATLVTGTDHYTLVYSGNSITGAELGDAYLYNGDLYVCANSRDGVDYFINVGAIQGPAGNDGLSSYVFIRYATDANGTGMSTSPSGKTYMGVATSNTNVAPTTTNSYTWSKFVGDNAKSIVLNGDSQVFKVSTSNVYTPATIKVTAQEFNTSVTTWTYSTNGGQTFVSTAPTGVSISGNVVTITGSILTTNSLVVKASDGTYSDVFTVYKAFDGATGTPGAPGTSASMAFLTNENVTFSANASGVITSATISTNVVAYNGATKTTPTVGAIANLPNGMTATVGTVVNNEVPIVFTVTNSNLGSTSNNNGSITIPVNGPVYTNLVLSWSKVNSGATGTSASLVDITPSAHYFKSTTGKDGVFTPDYIYLYPRFQNVVYSNWQYSVNGGTTWVNASGANGISISTYNSIANTLRIGRASTLYTDTITSISFRCNSATSGVYDTVSIAKIYDVVDLQIGGRNYIQNSETEWVTPGVASNSAYGVYRNGLNSVYEQLADKQLMISFEGMVETTDGSNGRIQVYGTNNSPKYRLSSAIFTDITPNQWHTFSAPINITEIEGNTNEGRIEFYGILAPVSKIHIRKLKLEIGNKATDWSPAPEDLNNITFQIYAPNGYLLTNELQSVTLQTFAYEGSLEITSGATFQWSHLIDDVWTDIGGATDMSLTVIKADVLRAKSYRCVMTYKSKTYTSTITVQDKTDAYNSIMCMSSNATAGECYWVLYTLVYSDNGEIDPLLGPISINAPASPVSGDYWYSVDATNATVQLKKYNGTAWANSTDAQSLDYHWNLVNDGSLKTPVGISSKVQIVSCHDFTATATLMCDVSNETDGVITQSSLSITDASDPIVSATEPTGVVNGQIWIKPNSNGTYFMSVWDATNGAWISSDMDTRNKVYTSKPTSYSKGDIWITESDTAHASYLEGTLLLASEDSTTYNASHWSATLKYDKDIGEMQKTLYDLSQYVDITTLGLRIGARSSTGELSPFTSLFTSTELAFYQNAEKLLTLANNQLTAPRVVVEEELEVQGTISLGDLQFKKETNGSYSFVVTK